MSKIKPITEVPAEDLLKFLEDNKDTKETSNVQYKNDIMDFISFFNLKHGEERITTSLLYRVYRGWSKKRVSKHEFSLHLGMFFSKGVSNNESFVLLNLDHNQLLRKTKNILKKKSKTNRRFYKEHFERYLLKYNINKGSFFVKFSVLYNIYDKWVYSFKKHNPLNPTQVISFFELFNFEIKLIDDQNWVGVDKSIIQHLTKDNINEMRSNVNKTK